MTPTHSVRSHYWVLGLSVAMLAAAMLFETDGERVYAAGQAVPPICWLRRTPLAGCPGCGLTRSVVALCHFDVERSLAYHPAGVLIVALAVFELPYRILRLRLRRETPVLERWGGLVERSLVVVVLVVSLVGWVWRIAT